AQTHRFHRSTGLFAEYLRPGGNANWAQCGGTTARRRHRLPRDDSVLSHCFDTPHRPGQRLGALVAPSEADAMKLRVSLLARMVAALDDSSDGVPPTSAMDHPTQHPARRGVAIEIDHSLCFAFRLRVRLASFGLTFGL